jgi:hypothetical protein
MRRCLYSIIILFFISPYCTARDNYELSTALGIGEVGINKVLCMKDGFTLLFHFENNKPIKVMVFDTLHKRVATRNESPELFDVLMLSTAVFKGLYEINGEAVLFFEQQNTGRHSLIRMQFNAHTGRLVDEKTLGAARGVAKPKRFFVMKHESDTGYQVLFAEEVQQFQECDLHVVYYNAHHGQMRDVPLEFNRKKYDYMHVVGAEAQPEGVCVSLGLSNMLVNGTGLTMATTPLYNHFLHVFYLPRDGSAPMQKTADLATDVVPYYTNFTYNPFASTINLLMLSYKDAYYNYGVEMRPTAFVANLLFRFDKENFNGGYNWLTNKLANKNLQEKTDTSGYFTGFPVMMHTNNNGLTTVVSESYDRYINSENYSRFRVFETYLGNFCITQFDDYGKELWGIVLPKAQYYRSYQHYYRPADFAKKWQDQAMFNDMPPQIYERQFVSSRTYHHKGNIYMIFNDGNRNFKKGIESVGDTVFTSALSNGCYYKIDKKKKVSKHLLFGEPLVNEYKTCFVEGADFDADRDTFAAVVRYKRSRYVSLRLAWAKLE